MYLEVQEDTGSPRFATPAVSSLGTEIDWTCVQAEWSHVAGQPGLSVPVGGEFVEGHRRWPFLFTDSGMREEWCLRRGEGGTSGGGSLVLLIPSDFAGTSIWGTRVWRKADRCSPRPMVHGLRNTI